LLASLVTRSAGVVSEGLEAELLSSDFVVASRGFRLGAASRGGETDGDPLEGLPDDQVVLIELDDGGVAITEAGSLRAGQGLVSAQAEQVLTTRGGLLDLSGQLFSLDFPGQDRLLEEVQKKLREELRKRLGDKVSRLADLGISWIGTKLLLEAIEARLPLKPGLYPWSGGAISEQEPLKADDRALTEAAAKGMLVFIHGTGSTTQGSFGDLATATVGTWDLLTSHYQGRIFGFEHRTFSESPIENALALADSLPVGAHLHLVSHSRGGLVADLLCLESIEDAQIDQFQDRGTGNGPSEEQRREAMAEQREKLRELRALLARKRLRITRYVRVACPARGTMLLGNRLDLFLSGLLSLMGMVPLLAGNPVYAVVKRVVLEIVHRRTDPGLIPGLAAMLPDSPFGALLAQATPRSGLAMATIAGDCEGGHPLQRLALMLSDAFFFERCANDLVVDTAAMQAGIAGRAGARTLLERARGVSHFHYFQRPASRQAVGRWLCDPRPFTLSDFQSLGHDCADRERSSTRSSERDDDPKASRERSGAGGQPQPSVVLLPDFFATHLWNRGERKRLWFDPADRSRSALVGVRDLNDPAIEPEKVIDLIYGELCRELLQTHRVERFAYDWRQPLDVSAEQLAGLLRRLLTAPELAGGPVRVLAHGMGGLVVRGMIARDPDLWRQLIDREGARLLMLGTPHQGTISMVAALLGHAPLMRQLARVDPEHDLQAQLEALAGFPGALQLLPRPGFCEPGPDPEALADWYDEACWETLRHGNHDRWFGDHRGPTPNAALLQRGRWLWDQGGEGDGTIPGDHPDRVISVRGKAASTPCGLKLEALVEPANPRDKRRTQAAKQLVVLTTTEGDGVVTWRSSQIGGVGSTYQMEADHGGLIGSPKTVAALVDLLRDGATSRLAEVKASASDPPAELQPLEVGPVPWPTDEELLRGLVGGQSPSLGNAPASATLQVSCHAMDLRFVNCPLMVGHYEQDPIAGAEALIDRSIVHGELTSRERLGVYAGPMGSATVVLMNRDQRELHQGRCRGAVVIGLGKFGDLSIPSLTAAVQVGALRYLLQIVDRHGAGAMEDVDVPLATLLLGQNSTSAISIEDSVAALVLGVLNANAQFARAFPGLSVRVGRLQIVEVFLDTAISATRALRDLEQTLLSDNTRLLDVDPRLQLGKGWRHRLAVGQDAGYWPRLSVFGSAAEGPSPQAGVAGKLSYTYLGERARAETMEQLRQPGLVEELVAASINKTAYNPDLSRTLFQLLVPTVYKDLARRLDQLVLVVDDSTANLPWELLIADDQPMVLQLALVRQLKADDCRLRVQQSPEHTALVIGNPRTNGFHAVFTGQPSSEDDALPPLSNAREEAISVSRILEQNGYAVEASIEDDHGVDVINKLYRRSYRVLHIAAHGVCEHLTHQGEKRTGVVLSNGMLITAAEISQMEVVPDLVFLNCCHLGTVTSTPFNRLAASVARALIAMGVKAVVACGWAVNDRAALQFAESFYTAMLSGTPFGKAVFAARKATYKASPESNTWGAYQAYGDPAFELQEPAPDALPRSGGSVLPAAAEVRQELVSPHELIDRLQQLEVRVSETVAQGLLPQKPLLAELERVQNTAPAAWLLESAVAMALADCTAALGREHWPRACQLYRQAIRNHRSGDPLPIRAIEQLANLEVRRGGYNDDLALIEAGLRRLRSLTDLMLSAPTGSVDAPAEPDPCEEQRCPAEWWALIGSAEKRRAAVQARALTRTFHQEGLQTMLKAIQASIEAYDKVGADPYHLVNKLTLQAVLAMPSPAEPAVIRLITTLHDDLRRGFAQEGSFWAGMLQADAQLALQLLNGSLATQQGDRAREAAAAVLEGYRTIFFTCHANPLERDSALDNLRLLSDLLLARACSPTEPVPVCARTAQLLGWIQRSLQEGIQNEAMDPGPDAGESIRADDGIRVVGG
jgi:CHAT domain-containing protein